MNKSRSGFTIVELLIVIVVIAILATISVVAYSGIQSRANDVAVQNDLSNLRKLIETTYVDTGRYTHADIVFKASKANYAITPQTGHNLVYCTTANLQQYAVGAMSKSGNRYTIATAQGVQQYTGNWGGDANALCALILPGNNGNLRGYASNDSATGPWRAWAGGN